MSIEAMKMALEALEEMDSEDAELNQEWLGKKAIAALRAAIEQAPVAWMYDFLSDNEVIRDWVTQSYDDIKRENGFNVRPLYTAPQYDQTSLELCNECGWRALIPGEGCLTCARQKAKPAAWVYPEFWDHLKQVNCGTAYRLPSDGMQPLYTVPTAPKPLRWVDTIIPGDRVIDNDDKTQARVSKLVRQRPAAPDYFKLEFDDGSYIDVTDNEMIANYKPLPESRKPVAYADSRIHGWPDCFVMEPDPPHTVPLYAAPREWVGLTEEEYQIIHSKNYNYEELALAVEAKLKEKNHAG